MTNVERTTDGAKEAPKKRDWRDLADRVLDENPKASLSDLAEEFSDQLYKRDGYRFSLAYEIIERHKRLRERPKRPVGRAGQTRGQLKEELAEKARVLVLDSVMPNNKPMRQCTGPEMVKMGKDRGKEGKWWIAIGNKTGRGLVGERLAESDVLALRK